MNKKYAIIMFALVILVVALSIYLPIAILNKTSDNKEASRNIETENKVMNQVIENKTNENITGNTTNTIQEEITNTIQAEDLETENTEAEKVENIKTTDDVDGTTNTSEISKEKAIELVEKDWGKDDSVYFSVDEVKGNGKYIVTVRNKSTTNEVVRYNVDLKNNKVEML